MSPSLCFKQCDSISYKVYNISVGNHVLTHVGFATAFSLQSMEKAALFPPPALSVIFDFTSSEDSKPMDISQPLEFPKVVGLFHRKEKKSCI